MEFINNGLAINTLITCCFSSLGLIWLIVFTIQELRKRNNKHLH
jgi:hypothetical protein